MKRELIQNVKAIPYTSGDVIDREGFLSGVVAVAAKAAGDVKVEVTHADTADGTFEAVPDTRLVVGGTAKELAESDVANFDLDLIGCKNYIKITVSGTAAGGGIAVVLGDKSAQPV
jgi:hypothetical protein